MQTLAFPNEGNAFFGQVYLGMKDYDRAFDYFMKAVKNREGDALALPSLFRNSAPELLQDPRTKALLKMIGLPN